MNIVTCPACGFPEAVRGAPAELTEIGEFKCDGCSARAVYGQLTPLIVVEPAKGAQDMLWIRIRFQDPKTRADLHVVDLDPKLAVELSRNLLSLVRI